VKVNLLKEHLQITRMKTMNEIYEECKGCGVINKCGLKPKYKTIKEECPCINCLVKGICRESCKSFDKYVSSFIENREEQKG